MAISEFETRKIEKAVSAFIERRRPPPSLRSKLDLGFRVSGQSVEMFEIRPDWQDPQSKLELPFAKATYVKSRGVWKVYWMRADLKWHPYPPAPVVDTVEQFIALVDEDEYACFFG